LISTSTRPKESIAFCTSLHELPGDRQPVDPPGPEHDVGTGLGEGLGEGDAEAGGGAGDDDHLVVESEAVENGHGAPSDEADVDADVRIVPHAGCHPTGRPGGSVASREVAVSAEREVSP
jgi:hypothetical protein